MWKKRFWAWSPVGGAVVLFLPCGPLASPDVWRVMTESHLSSSQHSNTPLHTTLIQHYCAHTHTHTHNTGRKPVGSPFKLDRLSAVNLTKQLQTCLATHRHAHNGRQNSLLDQTPDLYLPHLGDGVGYILTFLLLTFHPNCLIAACVAPHETQSEFLHGRASERV